MPQAAYYFILPYQQPNMCYYLSYILFCLSISEQQTTTKRSSLRQVIVLFPLCSVGQKLRGPEEGGQLCSMLWGLSWSVRSSGLFRPLSVSPPGLFTHGLPHGMAAQDRRLLHRAQDSKRVRQTLPSFQAWTWAQKSIRSPAYHWSGHHRASPHLGRENERTIQRVCSHL